MIAERDPAANGALLRKEFGDSLDADSQVRADARSVAALQRYGFKPGDNRGSVKLGIGGWSGSHCWLSTACTIGGRKILHRTCMDTNTDNYGHKHFRC